MKFSTVTLTRSLRDAIKAALAAHPGWPEYRAAHTNAQGKPLHTGNAFREDFLIACEALQIDVFALQANADANTGSPVDAPDAADATPGPVVSGTYEGADAAKIVDEVLAPINAVLSAGMLQPVRDRLTELAKAATAGPRTVVQMQTVHVSADAAASLPPLAKIAGLKMAREYFGLSLGETPQTWRPVLCEGELPIWDAIDAPAIDPNYLWDAQLAASLAVCSKAGTNLYLYGPAGTGKTEGARQFAALGRRPFVRLAINRTTEPADLIGQYLPKDGSFTWKDGPLVRAFRQPGCVILIDEPTFMRPGALAVFQTVLDTGAIHLPTGEVVTRAPGVFVIAADNTNGSGDETGRYADTGVLNLALIDRFQLMLAVDYLPASREAAMLAARSGVPDTVARHMVQYARLTRDGANGGKLTAGLTFRRLLAWAGAVRARIPSKHAFDMAIITPADPADRPTLRQLETTQGGHDRIDRVLAGGVWEDPAVPPQGVTQTPAGAAAAQAFADAPSYL